MSDEFYTWGLVVKDELVFIFSKNKYYLFEWLKENMKDGDSYIEFHKKSSPHLDCETFESVTYHIPIDMVKEAIEIMEDKNE